MQQVTNRVLRLKGTEEKVGIRRDAIYARIRKGKFPKPVKLGDRATGWLESELDEWIAQRAGERDGQGV